MTTTSLTWEEPARTHTDEIIETRRALQERPGTWARVHTGIGYIEADRWCGRYRSRGLSASRRVQPDGTYHVYAKWVA